MHASTIGKTVDRAARTYRNALALKDGYGELGFDELREQARLAASACAELGLRHGERFAIWAPNSSRWVLAALGGMLRGAVLTPINTRLKGPEVRDVVERTHARVIFAVGDFVGIDFVQALEEAGIGELASIVALDDNGAFGWSAFLSGGKGCPGDTLERDIARVGPGDVSDIIFTSGTTGKPKGVMATQGQTIANAHAWGAAVGLGPDDKYLGVNPFFHTFGYKAGWLTSLVFGTAMLPQARFDVRRSFDVIEREAVTVLPGPPTIFEDMLHARPHLKNELSSLRVSVTGAAVVPAELVRRMKAELGIDTVMTAYGLTESGGVATISRQGDPAELVASRVGRPVDGVSVRIVDDDGNDLPSGAHGEVWLKSDYNFVGYLDDPAATEEAYAPGDWLKTGDIGVLDENGYLKITGRKKEMYIVGGFNCYPAEVEFSLSKHPDVREVAVLAAPDARLGEVGVAFVTRATGVSLTEEELLSWARDRMANYKVPRRVVFLDTLPRTPLGKVVKPELAEILESQGS